MADEKILPHWTFKHFDSVTKLTVFEKITQTSFVLFGKYSQFSFFLFQLLFCNFSFTVVRNITAHEETSWILNLEHTVWVAVCVKLPKCIIWLYFSDVWTEKPSENCGRVQSFHLIKATVQTKREKKSQRGNTEDFSLRALNCVC